MELIERVARAIASEVWHDEPDQIDQMAVDWMGPAKAAIRAMLDGVEPVIWRYSTPNRPRPNYGAKTGHVPDGWTETPLYSLDAIKEAL